MIDVLHHYREIRLLDFEFSQPEGERIGREIIPHCPTLVRPALDVWQALERGMVATWAVAGDAGRGRENLWASGHQRALGERAVVFLSWMTIPSFGKAWRS